MNKRAVVVAACVLVLTACATKSDVTNRMFPFATSADVVVSVVNGQIMADPEILRIPEERRHFWVTWEIGEKDAGSGWKFNHHNDLKPGIVIKNPGGEFWNCHQMLRATRYFCFNKHELVGKKIEYKYDVNLYGPEPKSRDPIMIND